ncbi:MAG: hypothetical protein H8D65_02575 [Spirochaetes bacterium]|nr:hypothetical protein [Spirochaetota bacterium]
MIKRISVLLLLLSVCQTLLFSLGMQEKAIDTFDTALSEGTVRYNQGDLPGAAQQFNLAATSLRTKTAAYGYYNHGTVLAEMAEQSQDTEEKRTLLNSAYESLKRSVDLKALSDEEVLRARQNMQIVRERLLQLPPEQKSDNQQDQQDENQQADENQQDQPDQQNQPNNQGQNSQSPQTPDDLLAQQKKLSDKTQNGNEEKGDQEMEDILNQETAYEEQQNRLETKGGISDAERNW